ncbi:STAS domain-containing protein [Flavobacteriaceae bacterium R38]|nr:STAS domain-containing protein [Flavobacteriaceae bacterium R38]
MRPIILNNSGIFEIIGNIVTENASSVKEYFENLFENSDEIIISLDRVNSIDFTGVNALAILYRKAMEDNKALYIIGRGNKNIEKVFNTTKMDFILSRDVV